MLPPLHLQPINLVFCKGSYPSHCYEDGETNLEVGLMLRCFQHLSLPDIATQRLRVCPTTGTLEVCSFRSSRTRKDSSQFPLRLHRIWTELSHDVLNPAHVPL